ncbi:costars family protein ABRACL isoform X1 [Fukomys damarensis]|uniref:costars family protein ABRACL isoform X1 n=1 Tax=Fukomys damarensis TaxID=885580 RepID=UPI0008FEB2CD|nr:costars family protein ABRACL isoform X1 [Fukomys damarensis]
MNVDHEVNLLVEEIHRLGSKNADGKLSVKFGVLFRDDKCANLFEALVGTLKAAKRRKIVTYPGELLLQVPKTEDPSTTWYPGVTMYKRVTGKMIRNGSQAFPQGGIFLADSDGSPWRRTPPTVLSFQSIQSRGGQRKKGWCAGEA